MDMIESETGRGGSALSQTWAFVRRAWLKYRNDPMCLVDMLSRPVVFLVVFTALFAQVVSGGVAAYQGVIAPGMMVFATLSAASITASKLEGDVDGPIFDRIRTLPIARMAPLAGALVADIPQYLLDGVAMALIGVALGWWPAGGPAGMVAALAVLVFFTWAVSWACTAASLSQGTAARLASMLLLVLTFLSCAFVPLGLMAEPVRLLALANPVTHATLAVAALAEGTAAGAEVAITLAVSAALIAVCAPLSVRGYDRRQRA